MTESRISMQTCQLMSRSLSFSILQKSPTRVSQKSARVHAHSSPSELRAHQMAHAGWLRTPPRIKSWSELKRSKPTRCNISEVTRLQKRHLYIGRGASHLGCRRSFWANPFQVKRYGLLGEALLNSSPTMQSRLNDKVLLCHCSLSESCHGDVLVRAWEEKFPNSEKQDSDEEAAQAEELFRAAEQRQPVEEPESQSDDEPGQEPRCVWVVVHTKESCTTARGYALQGDGPLRKENYHRRPSFKTSSLF